MGKDFETRSGQPIEVRANDDGVTVAGYAAVFNQWADIGGWYEERIAPGAFDGRLGDDARFLINHEGLPLARVGSGTLKLTVDERGLKMETDLDASDPDAQRIIRKLKRGDLSEMSFAFRVEAEEWDESGDIPRRTITRVKELIDVAVVTSPAYGGTEIALRSLETFRAGNQEISHTARKRGMGMRLALLEAG